MIASLYQLDFISGATTLRLLDFGDPLLAELEPKATQAADRYAPISAAWSESAPKGGAQSDLTWSVVRDHASHAALRGYCIAHAAALPTGKTGILRLAIQGGETWEIAAASVTSSSTIPRVPSATYETITAYTVTGGKLYPVTAITLYPGVPWDFILQNWETLTANWQTY